MNNKRYTHGFAYFYDEQQRLTTMHYGSSASSNTYGYTYDYLNRVNTMKLVYSGLTVTQAFTYQEIENSINYNSTSRVETVTSTVGTATTGYSYTYDDRGNITEIYVNGVLKYSYAYDNLNQLVRENNAYANKTYVYTYDDAGNITAKKTYAYTTGTLGTVQSTFTYTYGNSNWGDQLTAYRGTSLTYDELGNPLSYYNGSSYTFTWTNGRQLTRVIGNKTTTYTYNADGIRTGKNVGGTAVEYILDGTQIVAEKNGSHIIRYLYDPQGMPVGMVFNGTTYLYEKNLQGDVIGIYTTSGTKIASYTYDAWGKIVSSSYTNGYYTPYYYNPFRYRGYYYDTESGFYYLQSRYYDPATGRSIQSVDISNVSLPNINGLYAYGNNNPVNNKYLNTNSVVNSYSNMLNSNLLVGAKNNYYAPKQFDLPCLPNWVGHVTTMLDVFSSFAGALETSVWSITTAGRAFSDFYYTAYGINRYALLDNLSSPLGTLCKGLGIGLIAADLGINIYNSFQRNYSLTQGITSFALTAAKDIGVYYASAKVAGAVGGHIAGSKLGVTLGSFAGPVGMIVGVGAGFIDGYLINEFGDSFIEWFEGLYD